MNADDAIAASPRSDGFYISVYGNSEGFPAVKKQLSTKKLKSAEKLKPRQS